MNSTEKDEYDILFEFRDADGNKILPQNVSIPILYNVIYSKLMKLGINQFSTYEIKIEYFLDDKVIRTE